MASGIKLDVFIDDDFAERFEVRTIPVAYAERLPNGEYGRLWRDFVAKGKLFQTDDVSLENLFKLFPLQCINLYDTTERGMPRIRFLGAGLKLSNNGRSPSGMPVREFGGGTRYAAEMARTIDTVAACGCPMFQHVMIHLTVHTYHRLLLPITDDGHRVYRVLGASVFPSQFRDEVI